MKAHTAIGAIGLFALASSANAGMLPVRWDIHANFEFVTGDIPDGPFSGIDQTWDANLSLTIGAFEEVTGSEETGPPSDPVYFADLIDQFLVDINNGDLGGYLLVGDGPNIDGAYLPRNTENFDSADFASDLPIQFDRGVEPGNTFELRFGFNGPADTFTPENPFLLAPNLDELFGTGFILTFENGARAIGSIDVWESTFVPTPGTAALLAIGAIASIRRKR